MKIRKNSKATKAIFNVTQLAEIEQKIIRLLQGDVRKTPAQMGFSTKVNDRDSVFGIFMGLVNKGLIKPWKHNNPVAITYPAIEMFCQLTETGKEYKKVVTSK